MSASSPLVWITKQLLELRGFLSDSSQRLATGRIGGVWPPLVLCMNPLFKRRDARVTKKKDLTNRHLMLIIWTDLHNTFANLLELFGAFSDGLVEVVAK